MPLNKILKLHDLTIVVWSVFQEINRYYPQVFLDECLFELWKCYNMKEMMFQKKLALINQINQKNVWFVIIVILKILVCNKCHDISRMPYDLENIAVMNVTGVVIINMFYGLWLKVMQLIG